MSESVSEALVRRGVADRKRMRRALAEAARSFVPYEIALGDDTFARLVLPQDLTKAEADRLCGVIQSLAFTPVGGQEEHSNKEKT